MLADSTVIFAIGDVARIVEFVFYAPVIPVVGEQLMLVGQSGRKAGDYADDFLAGFALYGARALEHENLRGEGKVDLYGTGGGNENAADIEATVGFFNRAMS